jgi:inosose dehydratase
MDSHNAPSRRSVLRTTVLTAAAAGLSVAAAPGGSELLTAAAPSTRPARDPWRGLKVGVASYSLRKLPLDAAIKGLQRVEARYVSIKDFHLPMKSTAEERQTVAKKFRDAGIAPVSCGVVTMPNDEAVVRNAFEYARDVGVPVIVCSPDPAALPLLERMVKQFDIRAAIHNHGPEDTKYPTPYDVLKLVDKLDERVGLCIDVGHTARAGADPAKAIRDGRRRLYDVHFKDVARIERRNSEVEVGRGVLDICSMLQALLDVGFQHHVGFEHERTPDDPLPGLAESMGYTKGVLSTLG